MKTIALAVVLSTALLSSCTTTKQTGSFQGPPGLQLYSLRADFQALNHKLSAEGPARIIYGVPQKPQDAFTGAAGCDRLDAVFIRAFSLDEAVQFLQEMNATVHKLAPGIGTPYSFATTT